MAKATVVENKLKEALRKRCACYVLITCTEPDANGKMDVELNYDGDETLAAFLIDNASVAFEEGAKSIYS